MLPAAVVRSPRPDADAGPDSMLRTRLALAVTLTLAALLTLAAPALGAPLSNCGQYNGAQTYCVFNGWWASSAPPSWMADTLTATTNESLQLAKRWRARFAATAMTGYGSISQGIPIEVGRPQGLDNMICITGASTTETCSHWLISHCAWGKHFYQPANGIAWIAVLTYGPTKCFQHDNRDLRKTLTTTLAHEVLETLVDGNFKRRVKILGQWYDEEVCDPVERFSYYDKANGVWMPDFTYPSFWTGGKRPYDYMGKVKHPFSYYIRRGIYPVR